MTTAQANTRPASLTKAPPGLRGVEVADTTIGSVRGGEGFYHYRHLDATRVAASASVEQAWQLLIDGELGDGLDIGAHRVLDPGPLEVITNLATVFDHPYQLLQAVLPVIGRPTITTLGADPELVRDRVVKMAAATPVILAAHRSRPGDDPGSRPTLNGDPTLSHAADWYRLATGRLPTPWQERAVNTYLAATLDHGFNASTFAARAVVSTGTDLASALMAGVGSLAGPLHGGAPALALDMIRSIGSAERAPAWVADRLAAGDKIMGFGHAVYRGPDPRSHLLKQLALEHGGELVERSVTIEAAIESALQHHRPDVIIQTNVEYYAGVVLHLAGLADHQFTPSFTVSRIIGWSAHLLEQVANNRIIRPSAHYVGPDPTPAADRSRS